MTRVAVLRKEIRKLRRAQAKRVAAKAAPWPDLVTDEVQAWLDSEDVRPETGYRNTKTGKSYTPHSLDEWVFLTDTTKRYALLKGGEGSGKSTAAIIRDLERIRAGCSGIAISPDFEHLKKSLWPEFRRWIPWSHVVPSQRYRSAFDWEPSRPFQLAFTNGAVVYVGGIREADVLSWEGGNVNWAHFDEPRRHKTSAALKILDGRVRIVEGGFPPQIWLSSTPRMHWLYTHFGPLQEDDPKAAFKADSLVVTLLTRDNLENLSDDFIERRAQTLTENEARLFLEAEWIDAESNEAFLPNITLWDLCEEKLPPLEGKGKMVLGIDAATGRVSGWSDCFAIIGVTRHPARHEDVAVRYFRTWRARPGKKIDFGAADGPENEIRRLCEVYGPVCVAYDRLELHDMMSRLNREGLAWFYEFGQQTPRLTADKQLLDLILGRRIAHSGDSELRKHIQNANRRLDKDGKRLRIVKREDQLPVDGAVALSMSAARCLYLNL